MIKLKIFNQNPAEVNSYALIKEEEIILIDPGFNGDNIIAYCNQNNFYITDIILTHGHFDHIQSIPKLAITYKFKIHISRDDLILLKNDEYNYARAFGESFNLPSNIDINFLSDKQKLNINGEDFNVITTPGHTKGSLCIKYKNWLFSGDTLFADSVGRTDLFSGNQSHLNKSLKKLTDTISNNLTIYPGHGKSAKMSKIKEINPYINS